MAHVVAMEIVEEMILRELTAGDRLPPEADMLEQFDVGRASLREGLRLLETYGLISIRTGQGGGPIVAELTSRELARTLSLFFRIAGATYGDLIEARMILDPVVARFAAERNDADAQSQLRAALEMENSAASESHVDPRVSADRVGVDFHRAVTEACGNPILIFLAQGLRTLYAEHLHDRGLFPREAQEAAPGLHRAIGQAILDGDGQLAQNLMLRLVRDFAALQKERTPWLMDERITWTN
jgi:DNA-binding FadR family transcriptional regulator